MSDPTSDLAGFAYGEDLESVSLRSLGYRLLAPHRAEPWGDEVEALARRLQAAPYSDHWPPTDLFCSVLLADGRRVVALARYGLADHTPSQRRGGLELIGVVTAANLDVRAALSIYHWLSQRRDAVEDLHQLGGHFSLTEIVAAVVPPPPHADPVPVLPVRLWQEGRCCSRPARRPTPIIVCVCSNKRPARLGNGCRWSAPIFPCKATLSAARLSRGRRISRGLPLNWIAKVRKRR